MISNPLKKIAKKLTLIDLLGTVWTTKTHDEWTNDFINWLDERDEHVFMFGEDVTDKEETK